MRLQRELERRAQLEQRFGAAAVAYAEASASAGLSARDSAARMHWRSARDRREFVAAYVEVTRDRPEWKALHEGAAAYLGELDAAPAEPWAPAPAR